MAQFFFNYREGREYWADDVGVEFESFENAYLDTLQSAREMWGDLMERRVDPRVCAFEITDADGNLLAAVNFNELLEMCGTSKRLRAHILEGTVGRSVETAHRTKQKLSQLQDEIQRTRVNLSALRERIALIRQF